MSFSIPAVNDCYNEVEKAQNSDLASILHRHSSMYGAITAIEENGYELSYSELHQKATCLAAQIMSQDPSATSPIGILIPRSLNHVLAQVAVIYSGRACVPLDDKLPDDHLMGMLENIDCSLLLTDTAHNHRLPAFSHLVVDHRTLSQIAGDFIMAVREDCQSCSHIFHTSGTTGKPKAVQSLAEGLLNLCFDPANLIMHGQHVGHGSSVIFDTSLVEIWATLLCAATIVIIPVDTVLDPLSLSLFIQAKQLDVLQLTTSLLTVTAYACPRAFSTLDTLITGGEAINCKTIRSIFEAGAPRRIINGYGPTECSIYTLWHEVSEEEAQRGEIPVGKPFGNVEVFLVNEDLSLVKPGEVGELLISGAGVAGGYIKNPDKSSKAFLYVPQLRPSTKSGPCRVYRTGDLMRANEKGIYYYIGRKDNQVKIRGQRVELEALESALLQTRLVSAAVVIKITPDEVDKGQFLLAYCIPASPEVTDGAILKFYIKQNPHFMVPRIQFISDLPLSTAGKADRKKLEEQYYKKLHESRATTAHDPIDEGDVARQLEVIWIDVLGLPVDHLASTDDFIAMGGTSLMAATMISRINRIMGISLRARMLYEHPTFDQLTQLATKLKIEGHDDSFVPAEQEAWLEDSQLGEELRPSERPIPHWQSASEGRIFLTGATGFVGVFLLATLVERADVHQVACLVRAEDKATAQRRLQKTMEKYMLAVDMTKVIVLPGNFALPKLGLDLADYDYYAEWASMIFHLGAKVSYVAPYSSHRQDNVIGTLNMLEFSNHKRLKPMHYSSTIASYGPTGYVTGSKVLLEDERPAPHLAALQYDTGYAQSQYVAESIVWGAIDNGFPIAVYRPGFVLGHSKSGICNPDDFVSRLFTSCMAMGLYPILPAQRKEYVPVDFVVNAMLHISASPRNLGYAYNLVQPDLMNAIEINMSFKILNLISPYEIRGVPYQEWVNSLSQRLDDPLHPLIPMLKEPVLGKKTRWEVYERMAEYGRENLLRALQDAPEILDCDPIEVIFQRSLESWLPCCSSRRPEHGK